MKYDLQPSIPFPKVLPPVLKRDPGRPKKKRVHSYGEPRKSKRKICSRCGVSAFHDSVTYYLKPT